MNFTDQPPTKPGFYAWKFHESHRERAREVVNNGGGNLICDDTGRNVKDVGGLWCHLLPASDLQPVVRRLVESAPAEHINAALRDLNIVEGSGISEHKRDALKRLRHRLELALQEMEAWPLGAETADLGRGAKPPNAELSGQPPKNP